MTTFHVESKVELNIPTNDFGISHMSQKNVCVMFGFHPKTIHVSKDEAYDDNNNVIRSIYQVPISGDFGLEWKAIAIGFKIVLENLLESSQNTILTLEIATFIANVVPHLMEIKQEVVPKHVDFQYLFIDLCNSSNEDGTPSISFFMLTSSLHTSHSILIFAYFQYSI